MTIARREGAGWRLEAPAAVPDPLRLVADLARAAEAAGGAALLGLDFPIGLPLGFVRRAGLGDAGFLPFLDRAHDGPFLEPAAALDEVSPARPFFPAGPVAGRGLKAAFLARLGLDARSVLRLCDRRGKTVRAACGLFWTLGADQVGKAAIAGWRELLLPARRLGLPVAVWPFEGDLNALGRPGRVVLAEAYPAEAYARVGLGRPTRKRDPAWRAAQAAAILAFAADQGVALSPEANAAVRGGFGPSPDGEDAFDSFLGALGMIPVAAGGHPERPPLPPEVLAWEGWMLGRVDLPRSET